MNAGDRKAPRAEVTRQSERSGLAQGRNASPPSVPSVAAPPIYRSQAMPGAKTESASSPDRQPPRRPVANPVNPPPSTTAVQAKMRNSPSMTAQAVARPAYTPQPVPKVLQGEKIRSG